MKQAPTEVLMGFWGEVHINVDSKPHKADPGAKTRAKDIEQQWEVLQKTLIKVIKAQAKQYNKHHKDMSFQIGD
jgi:hypothetical protein